MICRDCKAAADANYPELHERCPGDTQCDCQHRTGNTNVARTPVRNDNDMMKRKEE